MAPSETLRYAQVTNLKSLTPERSAAWTRVFCAVLLCATLANYANRVAFTQNSATIIEAFATDTEGYGRAEACFNWGFALGLLVFGFLADWCGVRLLYPAVVLAWSLAGASGAWATNLTELAAGRFFLGLFEAGHWPCALRATQRVFAPDQRTWGNSILQSGAAVGQIAMPLLVGQLYARDPTLWRWSFYGAGLIGVPWAMWWLLTVRESDLRRPVLQTDETGGGERELEEPPFWRIFLLRRWWVLLCVVLCINTLWHYVRVWMPLTLEKDHGYGREFVARFTSLYYLMTFLGSLAIGWLTAWLPRRGWNVHRARLVAFAACGLLSTLAIPAAFAPRGPAVLGCLLVVGLGSLGLFPIYYSLNQEISAKHQGKVGASLGFCAWSTMSCVHLGVGWLLKENPSLRPYLFATVGLGPLLAWLVLAVGWGKRDDSGIT